jgi:hypothetical protein
LDSVGSGRRGKLAELPIATLNWHIEQLKGSRQGRNAAQRGGAGAGWQWGSGVGRCVMDNAVALKAGNGEVTQFNPDRALQTVAVAEAGEKHWARAKDPTKLYAAIAAKITEQAKYVCWRDTKVTPSQKLPGAGKGKGKRISEQKSTKLPAADPGTLTAHRWRRSFCLKGETGTIIDKDKMALALDDASPPISSIFDPASSGGSARPASLLCCRSQPARSSTVRKNGQQVSTQPTAAKPHHEPALADLATCRHLRGTPLQEPGM